MYTKVDVDLSKKQQQSIANSIQAGTSARIKLTYEQLYGKSSSFLATPTQVNRIMKAKEMRKGIIITLSKKQIQSMKEGGFLPILLGSLVSSLAPVLFSRLFPEKQQGEGVRNKYYPPMSPNSAQPIYSKYEQPVPSGYILPGNGESASYNIEGFNARNAGTGAGLIIPGTNTAKKYIKKGEGMNLPTPKITKKKKLLGMGYLNPNSDQFQMLQ